MEDIIRKQMKDVIVPQNDIIRRPSAVPEAYTAPSKEAEDDRIESNPFFEKPRGKDGDTRKRKVSGARRILWAVFFAILLAGGFAVASYFATATIEITPIARSVALESDIVALKEASAGNLTFQFMSIADEKTKEVPATIEKKIQKKASGKVIIYNAYSKDSQRLIKNTRLEDNATHKIYRIDTSIVVPGAKVLNGKVVTPGSVEAVVYADVPGDAYDVKLLGGAGDFSIPGFKGDPRFAKFYGRMSEKAPISGGSSCASCKVPSDEAVAQAQEELKQDLKKEATEKARAQIPDGVSFFPGSIVIKFEEVPHDPTAESTVKVSMRATVSVFFFDTTQLTGKLAISALPENKNNTFIVSNMSALDFKFIDPVDNVVLSDISKIHFRISGNAEFVGKIDAQKLRTELAGKNKSDFSKIIADQKNISKADAVVRPMWKSVFPSDTAKITVKLLDK